MSGAAGGAACGVGGGVRWGGGQGVGLAAVHVACGCCKSDRGRSWLWEARGHVGWAIELLAGGGEGGRRDPGPAGGTLLLRPQLWWWTVLRPQIG